MAEIILGKVRGYLGQNLLHNWDFRNPVNQRALTGAISSGYCYDRWRVYEGGISVTITATYLSIPADAAIIQYLEGNGLSGKVVTFSVMIGGVVYSGTGTFPTSAGPVAITLTGFGDAYLDYATGKMSIIIAARTSTRQVQAVKLELGTVSTLHLDPPADYGVELAKCQRYLRKIPFIGNNYSRFPIGVCSDASHFTFVLPLGVTMRIKPTMSVFGTFNCILASTGVEASPITSIVIQTDTSGPDMVSIITNTLNALSVGSVYFIQAVIDAGAYLLFSAEL